MLLCSTSLKNWHEPEINKLTLFCLYVQSINTLPTHSFFSGLPPKVLDLTDGGGGGGERRRQLRDYYPNNLNENKKLPKTEAKYSQDLLP